MTSSELVNLYSDTQTRPSAAMRAAIAAAEVGDEQSGDDPTTLALERRVAELLGMEAAVFLPSGTMCNQIAILVHCRPGDEIIAAADSHVFVNEAGGGSALAGAQTWPIVCSRGIFSGRQVEAVLRTPGVRHHPHSRLVVIEQTANRGGGSVWKTGEIADVAATARAHGLVLHMDGARLLNAVVASGVSAAAMCAPCDTAWLDLTKGLGCPIGAVLAGPKDFVNETWRWKHRIGGALRQSGIAAAAGLYALDHNVTRLAEDHHNAKLLARLVSDLPGVTIENAPIETNIVFLDVSGTGRTARDICADLRQRGVRMGATSASVIRAVTHLDVGRAEIERATAALRACLAGPRS